MIGSLSLFSFVCSIAHSLSVSVFTGFDDRTLDGCGPDWMLSLHSFSFCVAWIWWYPFGEIERRFWAQNKAMSRDTILNNIWFSVCFHDSCLFPILFTETRFQCFCMFPGRGTARMSRRSASTWSLRMTGTQSLIKWNSNKKRKRKIRKNTNWTIRWVWCSILETAMLSTHEVGTVFIFIFVFSISWWRTCGVYECLMISVSVSLLLISEHILCPIRCPLFSVPYKQCVCVLIQIASVQFLMLYLCSFNTQCAEEFVSRLLRLCTETQRQTHERCFAASYVRVLRVGCTHGMAHCVHCWVWAAVCGHVLFVCSILSVFWWHVLAPEMHTAYSWRSTFYFHCVLTLTLFPWTPSVGGWCWLLTVFVVVGVTQSEAKKHWLLDAVSMLSINPNVECLSVFNAKHGIWWRVLVIPEVFDCDDIPFFV